MGTGSSRTLQTSQSPGQSIPGSGIIKIDGNATQQFQQSSNFQYLEFILNSPPVNVVNLPQQQPIQTNQNQNTQKQKLDSLREAIINYNRTWNFGNQSIGKPQSLLKQETYESFKTFVQNLLTNSQAQNTPPQGMKNSNKEIVKKIHDLLQGNYSLVNKTFDVNIFDIFPSIGIKNLVEVNLLDLASIIGAEHIVIYLLMCGADPSLSNTENKDSATLMLEYQILLCKSQPQQQSLSFIVLPRILCVLFLLGSIKEGVNLSAIFETKEQKNKNNLSGRKKGVKVRSSILNMLAQMPSNQSGVPAGNQTLQNGGSALLLLEILKMNKTLEEKPKLFKDINSLETPYDLNVLYNVLLNENIDDQTKINLVDSLVLKCGAYITNVPTFTSILVNKSGSIQNNKLDTFKKIELLVSVSVRNLQNIKPILQIFSQKNPQFATKLKEQYGNQLEKLNTNSKSSTKTLMQIINLLRQKNAIMAAEFDKFLENYYELRAKESVAKAHIYARAEQLSNLTGLPPQSNLGKRNLSQMASQVLQVQPQMQPPVTSLNPEQSFQQMQTGPMGSLNPAQQQMQTVPMGSLNPAPQQKQKGLFNRLLGKKNNKQKTNSNMSSIGATSAIGNQPYSPQKSKSLGNTFKGFFSKNPEPLTSIVSNSSKSQSTQLSSPLISSQSNPETVAKINISTNPAPLTSIASNPSQIQSTQLSSPPSNFPLKPLKENISKPLLSSNSLSKSNTNKGQTVSQTISPISPVSSPSIEPKSWKNKAKNLFSFGKPLSGVQTGGKKIQMRTYHFLKSKKYSERAFIAERPIIAADNAYDFMKLHYDIGNKKVTFTIHDRVNNKKYKYTARTLKDGTNVIKSAK